MVTQYPGDFDTDVQIPRVDDNITEIGGEAINGLRDAVFAIQKALGLDPQGTAVDLVARLAVALDDNGNLKASALAAAGLVSLPIDNSQIAATAGIEESKLDLDHSTVSLKTALDSLAVLVAAINAALIKDIGNLAQHVTHPGVFGRHRASDIDVVGGSFDGYTVKGAVDDLDDRLVDHVTDTVDAHDASAISLSTTNFQTIDDTNVQDAIETLEKLELTELKKHRDNQHGNGILQTQDTFTPGTNRGPVIIASASISSVALGDNFIKFSVAPSGSLFNSIVRNDIVEVTVGGEVFVFAVDSTESTNQVNFFGFMPVAGTGTAIVYRNPEEADAPSVLAMGVRKARIAARPAVLQLVHPASPFLLSSGFQGERLSAGRKNFRVLFPDGDTGTVDLHALMTAFSVRPSTWTVESVARILNEAVFAPGGNVTHFPLVAFVDRGELGIALDEPSADGYVEIGTISSASAMEVLGFTQGDKAVTRRQRNLYIDGYEITGGVRKILDAYGTILTTDTIQVLSKDLVAIGLKPGDLIRVDGPGIRTGTYVAENVTTNLIEFDGVNELDFGAGNLSKGLQVRAYSDSFALSNAPTDRTLYEFFVDGYAELPFAEFHSAVRATYKDTTGGGASLEGVFDLVAVSRGFKESAKRLFYDFSALTVELGNPAGGPSITDVGAAVSVPSPAPGPAEAGFRFRLFDDYGIEFVDMEVVGALPNADGYLDINVENRISEERFIQVATAIHDRTDFKRLDDRRLFGTVGRKDVRDDFSRDLVSYPTSVLRGNGVIYGLLIDGYSSSGFFDVQGGQVLVDGSLKLVQKTRVEIPADGEAATYNLFVDREGLLLFQRDDFHVTNILTTQSLNELINSSTETILAQVDVNASNQILEIRDLRRFVGNIDNQIELLVEENDITHGSFASLRAAVNWINAQDSANLPVPRIIKVRGEVETDLSEGPISLPQGVRIEGSSSYSWASSTTRSTITLKGSGTDFLVPADGCTLRDLLIKMETTASATRLVGDGTAALSNFTLQNCLFDDLRSSDVLAVVESGPLTNCRIENCSFDIAGGTAVAVLSVLGTADNIIMDGCLLNNTIVGTPAALIDTTNDLSRLSLTNTKMVSNSTGANQILATGGDDLIDSVVDNCVFEVDGTSTVCIDAVIKNTSILNSRFLGLNASPSLAAIVSLDSYSMISGCIFENFDFNLLGNNPFAITIANNAFKEIGSSGIDMGGSGGGGDITVANNTFDKSSNTAASHSFVKLTDILRANIVDNYMETNATSIAAGSMILIDNTGTEIVVRENSLVNGSATVDNQGFKFGINFNGAGGVIRGDYFFNVISENRVFNFIGPTTGPPSSKGITIKNASGVIVEGNQVINCSNSLDMFDVVNIIITNNTLNSGVPLIGIIAETEALHMDGSVTALNEANIIVTNNYISQFSNPLAGAFAPVVTIENIGSGTGTLGGVFSNNILFHASFSSAFSMLNIDASSDHWVVTGNVFWSLASLFSVEPITIAADDCMVALNNLSGVTNLPSSGAIGLTGNRSVDSLNKGQTYTVALTANAGHVMRTNTGSSSWTQNVDKAAANNTTYTASAPSFQWEFSNETIPVGATITKAEVEFTIFSGATTDLQMEWVKSTFAGSDVTVRALQDVSAVGANIVETITPGTAPIMAQGERHMIQALLQNVSLTWSIQLQDIRLTYVV